MVSSRALWIAGLTVAMLLGPTSAKRARADDTASVSKQDAGDKAEAVRRFKRGLDFFDGQNFDAALIEFRRANELAPNYRLQFNIGQICVILRDYPNAHVAFSRFLEEGATSVTEAKREEVSRELKKVDEHLARLVLTTNVPGATVTVDDVVIGTAPLPETIVSVGRRRLTLAKPGFIGATRLFDAPSGEAVNLSVQLVALEAVRPVASEPTPAPPRQAQFGSGSRVPLVASVTVAGVSLAAGALTGILSLQARSNFFNADYTGPDGATEGASDRRKIATLTTATDVLFGIAVVALGTATVLWLTRPSPSAATALGPSRGNGGS